MAQEVLKSSAKWLSSGQRTEEAQTTASGVNLSSPSNPPALNSKLAPGRNVLPTEPPPYEAEDTIMVTQSSEVGAGTSNARTTHFNINLTIGPHMIIFVIIMVSTIAILYILGAAYSTA